MNKRRIGIICFNDLALCQYLYKYTAVLDETKIEYDVIYWNRSQRDQSDPGFAGRPLAFEAGLDTYQPFIKKIGAFLSFRRFALDQIKEHGYDCLVVLTSQTAVALATSLLTNYSGKYIYDYRDITYETRFPFYKKLIEHLFNKASLVCFSSPGFMKAFGLCENNHFLLAHNSQRLECAKPKSPSKSFPIRLSYWGMIRQVRFFEKVCTAFGNDNRFLLSFHGEGHAEELGAFCLSNAIRNVEFGGRYNYLKDIDTLADRADIINCLYDNDQRMQPTLAVKLYDSIRFGIPILVSKGSFLEDYLDGAAFSLAVDIESDKKISNHVLEWYMSLDHESMCCDFERFRDKIAKDDEHFSAALLQKVGAC